jgi:hypothetical protein
MGVDRSTYDRLKRRVDRWRLEAQRVPGSVSAGGRRMPNEIGPHITISSSGSSPSRSAPPAMGRGGISAELAREKWGGIRISEHGV